VNRQRLLETFLRLTQVDSPSHAETRLAQLLITEFAERGWQARTDSSGNVIASLACHYSAPHTPSKFDIDRNQFFAKLIAIVLKGRSPLSFEKPIFAMAEGRETAFRRNPFGATDRAVS